MKVTDPVCGMSVDTAAAAATSTYKDITYYFCSKACKEEFDKNPESYVGTKRATLQQADATFIAEGSDCRLQRT